MDLSWHVHTHTIPAAMALLPGRMDSPQARAQLLAIGLQETVFRWRRQVKGPARGFWQFERPSVEEVLRNPDSAAIVAPIVSMLLYAPTPGIILPALADNDVLAAIFARLLLWVDPRVMPDSNNPDKGLAIYLSRWKPGKPHPEKWNGNFAQAWTIVRG